MSQGKGNQEEDNGKWSGSAHCTAPKYGRTHLVKRLSGAAALAAAGVSAHRAAAPAVSALN